MVKYLKHQIFKYMHYILWPTKVAILFKKNEINFLAIISFLNQFVDLIIASNSTINISFEIPKILLNNSKYNCF